jgi:hypothetical protein
MIGMLAVAERNMEMMMLIGRRLREAADAGQDGPLPESIQRGLARLGGLDAGSGGNSDKTGVAVAQPQLCVEPETARSQG